MRSNAYCGNLLWQSSLTLQAPGRFCESSVSCRRGSGSWHEKIRLIAKGLYESDAEDEEWRSFIGDWMDDSPNLCGE